MEEEKTEGSIETIEKEKAALLERLKEADRRYRYKIYEAKALGEMLDKKKKEGTYPPTRELKKRIQKLEFIISTEARTLQQERELVKEVRNLEKKLKASIELERMERKLHLINEDIRAAEKQVMEFEKGMDDMRKELQEKRNASSKSKKERKLLELREKVNEERQREREPFMKKNEDGRVDLGEICVIKKKEK